ncbi:MAG: serine/threonine-protein phosphatase, partial [candidate division Zixibacteria bacterium]|nr:serine/threonine-protein phosphatase [candidate division Zixibacteria bacterium]
GFLPGENIIGPRFEVYGFNRPAKEMGGDYYDMVQLSDDRVFVSLGDVSGKGMPAALLMANAQAVLRAQLSKTKDIPLPELAESLNRLICQFTPPEQYITAMFGVYDASENRLSYINAGHCPPFILRKTGVVEAPAEAGLVIGVLPDFAYPVHHIGLAAGETVFIYSDGITEAWNEKDEEFGEQRLRGILSDYSGEGVVGLGEKVYGEVVRHRGRQEQSDDITMVILRAV